jgi:hypothetical protein
VRRLALLVLLLLTAALVLAGCGHTDRPEGAVERWLTSLNQGAAGRPGRYANPAESNLVLPGWRGCDPGALDTIEVGNSRSTGTSAVESAAVPFRVEYATDVANLCQGAGPRGDVFAGTVRLIKSGQGAFGDGWRIVELVRRSTDTPLQPATRHVSAGVWLIGLLVALVLCGLVALLMRAMPRPAPVPSEPIDPSEARGL